MMKDELVEEKTGLAEKVALAGTQGERKEFTSFGKRGRQLRRTTRML